MKHERGMGPRGHGRGGEGHHGGHGRPEQGHWMEGKRRQRMFEQGDMKLIITHLLSTGPQHGYDLIKGLQNMTGGDYTPSPGVIYPTLTLLEEMGLAALVSQEGGKKLYAITEEGRQYLAGEEPLLARILERLASSSTVARGRQNPVIERAIQNFKMALHLRLAQSPLPEETLRAIADAIDKAAFDIERC